MPTYQAANYVTARQVLTQEDFDAWLAELTPEQFGSMTGVRIEFREDALVLHYDNVTEMDGAMHYAMDTDLGGWVIASKEHPHFWVESDANFQSRWVQA